LYNVLYTVSTQQYIITVIKYIKSGHITAKAEKLNLNRFTAYATE